MKKNFCKLIVITLVLVVLFPITASAQINGDALQLGLTRNFGYGGMGKIQGSFTLRIIKPPVDLFLVEFYLDNQLVAEINNEPFILKFHTSDFPEGEHKMFAVGYLDSGEVLESNQITKVFLSSDQAWGETQNILVPILAGTAVLSLLGLGIPLLFSKTKDFVVGHYGPAGGTVCPRCELPFSRSIFSPNLMVGKLVRCPHCGKISVLPKASQTSLREAETRFGQKKKPTHAIPKPDNMSTLLEDSRFED
jgi:hypothetical protein